MIEHDMFSSEQELRKLIADHEFAAVMASMDVDWACVGDMCSFIFRHCRDADGNIAKKDFKKVILDLRGKEPAKVKHHVETRKFVHSLLEVMDDELASQTAAVSNYRASQGSFGIHRNHSDSSHRQSVVAGVGHTVSDVLTRRTEPQTVAVSHSELLLKAFVFFIAICDSQLYFPCHL